MLQYLRIAVTVLGLLACGLSLALWVRSYRRGDMVHGKLPGDRSFQAISCRGMLAIIFAPHSGSWQFESRGAYEFGWRIHQYRTTGLFESVPRTANRHEVAFSYLFILLPAAAIAAAPWIRSIRWRFSLRTLLIAMALVAGVLGIVVSSR